MKKNGKQKIALMTGAGLKPGFHLQQKYGGIKLEVYRSGIPIKIQGFYQE